MNFGDWEDDEQTYMLTNDASGTRRLSLNPLSLSWLRLNETMASPVLRGDLTANDGIGSAQVRLCSAAMASMSSILTSFKRMNSCDASSPLHLQTQQTSETPF
jgi:hypothetical protein